MDSPMIISRHLNAEPPTLADTRPELASLDPALAAALAKDPDDRFPRCLEFARALAEQAAAEVPSLNSAPTARAVSAPRNIESAKPAPVHEAAPPAADTTATRTRWVIPAALVAVVLLACAIKLVWRPWQRQHPGAPPIATSITPTVTIAKPGSPTVTVAPSQSEVEPKTLEAATAAEQGKTDRFAPGDFAGEWLLFSRRLRDVLSQNDYVTYAKTCWKSPLGMTVTGLRMEGDSKAIVRGRVSVVTMSYTMVYEDGRWYQQPAEDLAEQLGKPVEQMIAAENAKGRCKGYGGSRRSRRWCRWSCQPSPSSLLPLNSTGPAMRMTHCHGSHRQRRVPIATGRQGIGTPRRPAAQPWTKSWAFEHD
jgi:hypothetical protein